MKEPALAWRPPEGKIRASKAEVHVWRASLRLDASTLETLRGTLAADEHERAGRFAYEELRHRYIAARGLLRCILSLYVRTDPAKLCFFYNYSGKPALEAMGDQPALTFNLSHSGGMALVAVTRERELGVDIEQIRKELAWESIMKRFFTGAEAAFLWNLAPSKREKAFFKLWTLKEAYLKARGGGLPMGLDWFSVVSDPGEPTFRLRVPRDPEEGHRWSLLPLKPGPRYAGALAVEGRDVALKCWQWPRGTLGKAKGAPS